MSPFIPGLLVGFLLGLYAGAILLIVYGAHRRIPPPTMAKRKQPNAQGEKVDVNYAAMGATGLED